MKDWQNNNTWQHWLKHSILPIIGLLLFLALPQKWFFITSKSIKTPTIRIELTKTINPIKESLVIKTNQAAKAAPTETQPETQRETIKQTVPAPQITYQKPLPQKTQTIADASKAKVKAKLKVKSKTTPVKTKITASDVQIMMSKAIDPQINDPDFSARQNDNQFIKKNHQAFDPYADLPYINEETDAPRLQMAFYSTGYTGSVERFFDKITYKKTFTTKYGTKINCAIVGILAMCGWK